MITIRPQIQPLKIYLLSDCLFSFCLSVYHISSVYHIWSVIELSADKMPNKFSPYVSLSTCLRICLSVCLRVCLSVFVSVCLSHSDVLSALSSSTNWLGADCPQLVPPAVQDTNCRPPPTAFTPYPPSLLYLPLPYADACEYISSKLTGSFFQGDGGLGYGDIPPILVSYCAPKMHVEVV